MEKTANLCAFYCCFYVLRSILIRSIMEIIVPVGVNSFRTIVLDEKGNAQCTLLEHDFFEVFHEVELQTEFDLGFEK